MLVNLVAKKHVRRRRQGKAYYYMARVPRTTLLQSMTGMLKRVFAGGSSMALVAQLMETGDIKAADLEAIRAAAVEADAPKSKRRMP